jgi:membrane protease YdiL (CAAX protease family)
VAQVLAFVVTVTALAWLGPLLGGSPASPCLGFVLWGVAPLAAALLVRAAGRDWSDAGFRPRFRANAGWYALSLLAFPFAIAITVAAGVLFGQTRVSGFSAVEYLRVALTALPFFLVFAFFEETGWRGFLVPKLATMGVNRFVSALIVGVVWATWHLPYLRELTWVYTAEDFTTFVPRLYLGAIAFSVLYGEVRMATGSVWPAVLMHGMGNAFGHPLAAEYLRIGAGTAWLGSIGFDGLLMAVLFVVLGLASARWRVNAPTAPHI